MPFGTLCGGKFTAPREVDVVGRKENFLVCVFKFSSRKSLLCCFLSEENLRQLRSREYLPNVGVRVLSYILFDLFFLKPKASLNYDLFFN